MIRILHAYPDLLNLYGGDADLRLLAAYLHDVSEEVTVDPLTAENIAKADLIYFGAGTENKMLAAARKLMPMRDALLAYHDAGKQLIFVGSSAALPMQTIRGLDGKEVPGLGLLQGRAVLHEKRVYTELLAEHPFNEHFFVGAYNSSLNIQTEEPAFLHICFDSDKKVGELEGVYKNGLLATQTAAPLLVRNPGILDHYADTLAGRELPDPQAPWYRQAWMGYVCAADILKNAMHK
jgi:CobQ-like glutamine amidotransferase family enzyme